ncbi:MAG: hypothetical protein HY884_08100 [Deltaproteobacteria bacterium]|nr:hypothetical protein [Deltaproteobacteria bacterium]
MVRFFQRPVSLEPVTMSKKNRIKFLFLARVFPSLFFSFLALSFFCGETGAAHGKDGTALFEKNTLLGGRELSAWQFENISSDKEGQTLEYDGAALSLTAYPWMAVKTPPGARIPAGIGAISLKIDGARLTYCTVEVTLDDSSVNVKQVKFLGAPGTIPREYKIYIGDIFPEAPVAVNSMRIILERPGSANYKIESLKFYNPGVFELAGILWGELWEPEVVEGKTINNTSTPKIASFSVVALLYAFAITLTAAAALTSAARKTLSAQSIVKAFVCSLVFAAFLLALRMDYNWALIWKDDYENVYGRAVVERTKTAFSGDLNVHFAFVAFVKNRIPPGKTVSPASSKEGGLLDVLLKYYLLPVKTSKNPDFVWVTFDKDVRYDPGTGVLLISGSVFPQKLRFFTSFNEQIKIFEVLK